MVSKKASPLQIRQIIGTYICRYVAQPPTRKPNASLCLHVFFSTLRIRPLKSSYFEDLNTPAIETPSLQGPMILRAHEMCVFFVAPKVIPLGSWRGKIPILTFRVFRWVGSTTNQLHQPPTSYINHQPVTLRDQLT